MVLEQTIMTKYAVIRIYDGGRRVEHELHASIKESPHHRALTEYVDKLIKNGFTDLNCDHISADICNRAYDLKRGNRRLDVIYHNGKHLVECELKTERETGQNRTYDQLQHMAQFCTHLVLLVPRHKIEFCREMLKNRNINTVQIDTYE